MTATTNTTVSEIENGTVIIENGIGGMTTMTDSQRTGTLETEIPAIYETHGTLETPTSVKGRETTEILATETFVTLETFATLETATRETHAT